MKNIEKYNESKAALNAYNSLPFKRVPFDVWLECEYKDPHSLNILEAAEEVTTAWHAMMPHSSNSRFAETVSLLSESINREKEKSGRNFNRYMTWDSAYDGFRKFCNKNKCSTCRFHELGPKVNCVLAWIYDEVEKEDTK